MLHQGFHVQAGLQQQLARDVRVGAYGLGAHRHLVEGLLAFGRCARLSHPVGGGSAAVARDGDVAVQARQHAGAHAHDDHGVAQQADEVASQQVGGHQVAAGRCRAHHQVTLLHVVRQVEAAGRLAHLAGHSVRAFALEGGSALGVDVVGVGQGVEGAHQAVALDLGLGHAHVGRAHGGGGQLGQGFGLELLSGQAALDGVHGHLGAARQALGDLGNLCGVVARVNGDIRHDAVLLRGGGEGGCGRRGCVGRGVCIGAGVQGGLQAAADADGGVSWHRDQRHLEGLPVGDAEGFHTIPLFNQLRLVDHVADADVAADAVTDVLPHFLRACALPKAHDGTGNPVRADLDGFDDANHVPGVVVDKQIGPGAQARLAHGLGRDVQNLHAPVALVGRFAGEGQAGGAGLFVDGGALHLQGALGAALGQGALERGGELAHVAHCAAPDV